MTGVRSSRLPAISILFSIYFIGTATVSGDITADWNRSDASNPAVIDHSAWQTMLDTYLETGSDGINLFRYAGVGAVDRKMLKGYLTRMQALDPRIYTRDEQMAYWINLYNALTVHLVIDHYPVESIKKIGGLFSFGPWDEPVARIAGQALSLNDIEHRILRPVWHDPRIHYAVNCASLGCPNLSPRAYRADNLESLLDRAARDYVNHSRGLRFVGDRLVLSSIYDWYREDFGGSDRALLEHLEKYAKPGLRDKLSGYSGPIDYEYDWRLNGAR